MVRHVARAAALVLFAGTMLSAAPAMAAGHHDWPAVERIRNGERIAIYEVQRDQPDACDFLSADDSFITCTAVDSNTRMIFPRASVRGIAAFEPQHGWDTAAWIKAGLVTALSGAAIACVAINPLCLLAVISVGVALLDQTAIPPPFQPPQSHQPRIRRRLVYRLPAQKTATP